MSKLVSKLVVPDKYLFKQFKTDMNGSPLTYMVIGINGLFVDEDEGWINAKNSFINVKMLGKSFYINSTATSHKMIGDHPGLDASDYEAMVGFILADFLHDQVGLPEPEL